MGHSGIRSGTGLLRKVWNNLIAQNGLEQSGRSVVHEPNCANGRMMQLNCKDGRMWQSVVHRPNCMDSTMMWLNCKDGCMWRS